MMTTMFLFACLGALAFIVAVAFLSEMARWIVTAWFDARRDRRDRRELDRRKKSLRALKRVGEDVA